MSEHTKGPWQISAPARSDKADDYALYVEIDGKRHIIAECYGRSDWEHEHPSSANARRIVACVNALEGYSEDALSEMEAHGGFVKMFRLAEAAATERDTLREQLETCKAAHMSNCLDADKLRSRISLLREALEEIANHEGVSEIIARAALAKVS